MAATIDIYPQISPKDNQVTFESTRDAGTTSLPLSTQYEQA